MRCTFARRLCLAVVGSLALLAGRGAAATVYPGTDWQGIPTAELGAACRDQLATARNLIAQGATSSLVAVQGGRILLDYGPTNQIGIIASARKSLLAMLYGRYVADGTIKLDRTLADLDMDDIGGLLPIERTATVRDLLAARSAVYHPAANNGDDLAYAPPRGSQAPGSAFLYNNWGFNAAGAAFERMTGRDLYRAFESDIGGPIGLQDYRPELHRRDRYGDVTKSIYRPYHFVLSARDMARIGYLMLRHGNWDGRQLVPADWVDRITTPATKAADMQPPKTAAHRLDYGYFWWLFDQPASSPFAGAYTAWGLLGQYILVMPQRDLVIAHRVEGPHGADWTKPDLPQVRLSQFVAIARAIATAPCLPGEG